MRFSCKSRLSLRAACVSSRDQPPARLERTSSIRPIGLGRIDVYPRHRQGLGNGSEKASRFLPRRARELRRKQHSALPPLRYILSAARGLVFSASSDSFQPSPFPRSPPRAVLSGWHSTFVIEPCGREHSHSRGFTRGGTEKSPDAGPLRRFHSTPASAYLCAHSTIELTSSRARAASPSVYRELNQTRKGAVRARFAINVYNTSITAKSSATMKKGRSGSKRSPRLDGRVKFFHRRSICAQMSTAIQLALISVSLDLR